MCTRAVTSTHTRQREMAVHFASLLLVCCPSHLHLHLRSLAAKGNYRHDKAPTTASGQAGSRDASVGGRASLPISPAAAGATKNRREPKKKTEPKRERTKLNAGAKKNKRCHRSAMKCHLPPPLFARLHPFFCLFLFQLTRAPPNANARTSLLSCYFILSGFGCLRERARNQASFFSHSLLCHCIRGCFLMTALFI